MHQYYKDILDRIDGPPTWFDDYGVPRFGDFSPEHLSNVRTSEAALAEVSCQNCGRRFHVALTEAFAGKQFSLSDEIRLGRVCYGDPPNVGCCWPGPTMSSVMHTILEYWFKDHEVRTSWQRDPLFEGPVSGVQLNPPDTVAEALAAASAGASAILVKCTSRRNRYDLAGRIMAARASDGRVVVLYPDHHGVVVGKMLDGFLPGTQVGNWKDSRQVTLADFFRIDDIDLHGIGTVVVLAAPRRLNGSSQKAWDNAVTRLSLGAANKVTIELALTGSRWMIPIPDVVVQAGRMDDPEE